MVLGNEAAVHSYNRTDPKKVRFYFLFFLLLLLFPQGQFPKTSAPYYPTILCWLTTSHNQILWKYIQSGRQSVSYLTTRRHCSWYFQSNRPWHSKQSPDLKSTTVADQMSWTNHKMIAVPVTIPSTLSHSWSSLILLSRNLQASLRVTILPLCQMVWPLHAEIFVLKN